MTITQTDIKLLASERMSDTTDGGGRRTSNVIADGVAGNIFPKVSRLDSTYGRVNLRKVFGAVQTASLDTFAGAHAVIMQPPVDKNIIANLFSTSSDFDTRTEARDRIESYVIAGPESRMTLYGRQLAGSGAISAYQQPEEPLPEVGQVYCLSSETGSVINFQQYVRITDVSSDVRTFEDDKGTYTRRVVTMKIGASLRYEFDGPDTPQRSTSTARPSLVRMTTVADAARYYGIAQIAEPAASGALSVKVSSVYSPIVPTTQRESPLSNASISGSSHMQPSGDLFTYTFDYTQFAGTTDCHLPTAVNPGSLKLHVYGYYSSAPPGPWDYSWTLEDVANNGTLVTTASNRADFIGEAFATIDYETGIITFGVPTAATNKYVLAADYVPAVRVGQVAHTLADDITLQTRGTVFAKTLQPLPAPGTLVIDYRALGKWYRLRDDGTGALSGDDKAYGTGTVDYASGAVVVTLGALPDVGSSIMWGWASPTHYQAFANATSDAGATVKQSFNLANLPVKPGSVTISYLLAGVAQVATSDVLGNFNNHGITGTVNHATGRIQIEYTSKLPDVASTVTVAYQQEAANTGQPTGFTGTVTVTDPTAFTLTAPIAQHGLELTFTVRWSDWASQTTVVVKCGDDGNGNLVTLFSEQGQFTVAGQQVIGTIDYATGNCAITAQVQVKTTSWGGWYWRTFTAGFPALTGDFSYTTRTGASANFVNQTENFGLTDHPVIVDLTRTHTSALIAGSVLFNICGKRYIERNGVIYTDLLINGSGTAAGTVDYAKGECSLTAWNNDTAISLSVASCLAQWGTWVATQAWFRTAGSPLRAQSAYVQVTSEDGVQIGATSDQDGNLVCDNARGKVNNDMGVVFIEWGQMVPKAGNETQEWYDASTVVGDNVWKPRRVEPGTLVYDGVVLTNLPLNADQLGLDPVRLPSDGRVPIFRPADVVVIHNTKTLALPNPPVAGATYSMARINLSELWLVDANGARVDTSKYVVDLAGGNVTMAANLDLTGAVLPWSAKHRIEQVALLTDVQINGELAVAAQLAFDFDADTYVSSALLFGDMVGRVANVFDQTTWTGVWQDSRIGNDATATFDTIDFPIVVQNDGAVTERWRINFTSTTAFQVIGEDLGVIATGSTAADCSPVNLLTGKPYFVLKAAGWGAGWAVGNQLRFNTIGATAPIWIARTVLPGATLNGDSLDMQLRGDVDA